MDETNIRVPLWIKATLFIAFAYSVAEGIIAMFLPGMVFASNQVDLSSSMYLWQTVAVADITLGIGFLIAYADPYRRWPLVLLGLIFKTFGSLVFVINAYKTPELWGFKNYVALNDLIWILPFTAILYKTYRHSFSSDEMMIRMFSDPRYSLDMFETNEGDNLNELSQASPVMLIFLRHFGCTFCRECIQDISRLRSKIESKGTMIVFVHMLEDEELAHQQLSKFSLQDIATIADPEAILYKKFGLRKGTWTQLFGIKVWVRGIIAGVFKGMGIGKAMGDPTQMPGLFLLYKGEIQHSYIHHSAADRPEYFALATCDGCNISAA